jgi:methylenetetrahydrofolate reductase (NADPH)
MASAPKGGALKKGIEIAGRMIRRIKEEKICDGVHIMAIGKEETIGLRSRPQPFIFF